MNVKPLSALLSCFLLFPVCTSLAVGGEGQAAKSMNQQPDTADQSEVVVIVHASNTSQLNQQMISKIFLGKAKTFPGGKAASPVGLKDDAQTTQEFNEVVLNKKSAQLKSYWSKLVFTGKGEPPQQLNSDAEVIDLVKSSPDAIGFISSDEGVNDVRIVGRFER